MNLSKKDRHYLRRVGLIIDMDGFELQKEFQCKELGVCYTYKDKMENFFFKLKGSFYELPLRHQTTAKHVYRAKHGLPYANSFNDLDQSELPSIVSELYKNMLEETNNTKNIIAYKGGHLEKRLLNSLNIQSLDLESYGCPTIEQLITKTYKITKVPQCGRHEPLVTEEIPHCPLQETAAFKVWLKDFLNDFVNK